MQRVKISLLCLLWLSLAGVLAAQTAVDPNSDVGSASLQDFSGGATLSGTYFDVRYMSGSGVGYQNGYTQIGAFAPYWLGEDAFIAPNARLLLTDNSGIGANGGLVGRRYSSNLDRIFGINGYFDTDVTRFGNRYNQLGLGVESLGQYFDFRANGYVPTGGDKTFIRETGLSNVPFFFENRIGFIGTRLMEQALRGADAEVGVPVTPQTPWLRAYAGGYAYQQDGGKDPVGVRARLEGWVSNDLSLGVTTTWDKQFGTNVNFVADWRFSGFMPTRYFPQWTTRERMLMPVQRQWRITAGNFLENHNVLAFNPRDNQPYFVVWVDNSAPGTNAGTFENPYNDGTLPNTVPAETDLVLVRRGNSTELAPLNGSITLPDYARMLGEGKAHIFDAYADNGPFHVTINDQVLPDPAFTNPVNANNYPFITNTDIGLNGGDIIRVGSHNEVSALVLEGATGRGIFGNNVGGFHFNNLEITNNIGGGIRLQDAFGAGMVTLDGQIINGGVIRDINVNPVNGWSYAGTGLGDNAAGGIYVDTGAPALNLAITNVAMNANPGAQLFGINLQADDGALVTTLTNVQTNGFGPGAGNTVAGIILGESNQFLTATLENVSSSNNTGDGLQVTGTNGVILATITDSGSVFNGNSGSGIVYSQAGGVGTLDMTNIQANSNGVDGLGLFGSVGTVMNANVRNSFLTGNTRDGIHVSEVGGATVNLLVDLTDVSFNDRDGLFFRVDGSSTLNATFIDTNLSDNTRHGIRGIVTANSIVNLSLTDSPVDRSGQDGFFFDVDASELHTTAVRSSFSNSGQVGPSGNGIVGNVTSAGLATFDFTSTPVSNNLDNGLFVRTSGLSNFQGVFTDSPFDDNGNTMAGSGIRLDLDNSPNSSLDLIGALTTINRNGNNGFELNATNGTVFTSTFTDTQIVDNGRDLLGLGRDGVHVTVDLVPGADSTVTQTFTNVTITNTVLPGTQMDGYDFRVGNGGDLTATFTGGSLSDNFENATDGSVTGAGSTATVLLDGVAADRSGGSGALLRVETGGELNFAATNGTSLSNGARGVNVFVVDPLSVANIELNQAILDGNVAEGFRGIAQNQGTLNACIRQTSFQANGSNGISLTIQGAGAGLPSTGNVHIENSLVNNNLGGGLLASATDGGHLNYRSVNTTYNTNGVGGVFDGVHVDADGAGTRVLMLFSGDSANDNTDDGFDFNASNGATLTAELDGVTATGNAGYGVNFNATGATTNAMLLMTGTNTLTGNDSDGDGNGGAININVVGVNQTVLSINGSFDDSPGDGIFINLVGVNNALVAIQGPGTIDRSGQAPFPGPSGNGDGIDIRMTNVINGSILISGFTSINDSAADGIHIEMDNVTSGALEINGTTSINNSGDDAIDISLLNTTLDGAPVLVATLIDHLTLVDSLVDDPLTPFDESCLPAVVSVTLDSLALVAEPFTINAMQIDNSTNRGISINSVDSTISTLVAGVGTGRITNNVISNSLGGDGLVVVINNTVLLNSADGLLIDSNSSSNNAANGFNFDFTNSPIDGLTITNNTGGVTVNTGLGFTIIGNTFPNGTGDGNFNLINTSSTPTADIVSFTLDTSTSVGGAIFNTVSGANFPFTPFGGTDATTGLLTVNGTPVPPYPNNLVADFSQFLGLTFNDFQPGENFAWDNDFDFTPGGDETVLGSDLIGSTINVGFTGGLFLGGSLVAVAGDPTSSTFVATSGNIGGSGIATNGLDGIRFSLNNSSLTNLNMSGNQIEANGTSGVGHGINFETVVNSNITGATIGDLANGGNTITNNTGDGFRLINPNTAGAPIDLTFNDNTITGNTGSLVLANTGVGINVQVNNAEIATVNINSLTTGNQISNNASLGVHLAGVDSSQVHLTMGGAGAANVLDANVDAGVGITLQNSSTGSINVTNTTMSNTVNGANAIFDGSGMQVRLTEFATVAPFVIDGTVGNGVTFADNAGSGFNLALHDDSVVNNLVLQSISSLRNDQHQVHVERHANAIVNVTMDDSTLTGDATSLDGFSYNATNFMAAVPLTVALNRNTISTNRDGVAIDTSANVEVVANIIENTIFSNRDNGIRVTTLNASSFGDPSNGTASQILGNTITGNGNADGEAGIRLVASDVSFQNVLIGASGAVRTTLANNFDGIRISDASSTNPFSTPDNNYQIQQTDIIDSTNDGIQLDLSGVGTRVYIGDPLAAATVTRDDVIITRTVPAPGGTGHGINVNAESGPNNLSIRNATIEYSGLNGVNVSQTGGDLTFNLQATEIQFSGERGLAINVTGNSGGTAAHGNNYNVGGTGANEGVLIQNSGQQGILFRTLSPVSASGFIDLGRNDYNLGAQNDPATPNVIRARLNLINSQVVANGTVGNVNSDGIVLAIGSNTRQDVLIAGTAVNGNVLDDLRIFPFVSVNPPLDSVNNPTTIPPTNNPHDFLRLDPIARLSLVFGSTQSMYDSTTTPPVTNPQAIPLIPQGMFPTQTPDPIVLATRNTGEQINVTATGTGATAGIAGSNGTFLGDALKAGGRGVFLDGQVQIGQFPGPGLSDASTFADSLNQFVQFGVEQDLDGAFFGGGFTLNPANVFP